MMIDGRYPAGQPSNALDNSLRLVELKTLAQRGVSVEERARRIQRDVEHHAKELDAMDDRSTVYPELMSYGPYVALVVGRFGEFSKDFATLRDYIARHKAYAYVEHFNSSINFAMSMFKLSITTRWALMAARGWARLILDRRRNLINRAGLPRRNAPWKEPRSAITSTTSLATCVALSTTAHLLCSILLLIS